jgi:hypothetical protein
LSFHSNYLGCRRAIRETLVFAAGDGNSVEARFAAKLATVLKNTGSRLRLKIVANADSARAQAQFDRRRAEISWKYPIAPRRLHGSRSRPRTRRSTSCSAQAVTAR